MEQEYIMEMMEKPQIKEFVEMMFADRSQKDKEGKVKKYKFLNKYAKKGQILFVGSSLMELFPINELQQSLDKQFSIYNRGIGGYVTTELLSSMEECIFELEPSKIFINIGTNDMNSPYYDEKELIKNYDEILN